MMYTEWQWQEAENRVREYLQTHYPSSRFECHRWEIVGAVAAFGNHDERLEFHMDDLVRGLVQE